MTENIFDNNGRFILKDYKNQKPFTNFLPGIAGFEGIPMWVFYVNRGQANHQFWDWKQRSIHNGVLSSE